MRRLLLGLACLLAGLSLMLNPLYLPAAVGEPEVVFVHSAQETDAASPEYDADDVVAYDDLSADAQAAFDRALDAESGETISDPDERVAEFDYPREPELGNGLTVVERDGTEYELWTHRAEEEGTAAFLQRVALQPALFLVGFFGVAAGVVLIGATFDWWDGPAVDRR